MLDVLKMGSRIRELRRSRGLTQQDFAKELSVSYQAVSAWERGVAPPELENILRIATYFGVLVDDLLRHNEEELLLGVDGGGTKTAFAVSTRDGHLLHYFTKGGSNPNGIGLSRSLEIIDEGILEAIVRFPSITSVFCGIAGAATADNALQMTSHLTDKFPSLKISVKTDSANLLALDDTADMAIISGTGSVVYVRTGDKYERIGGWGYLFDSAGSGYDIGRDAVTTALSEEDEGKEASGVTRLLRERLSVERIWDGVKKLYDGGREFIASLSSVVFEAYKLSDKKAIDIVDRNAKRLAELLNLGMQLYSAKGPAIAGGGIFEHHFTVMEEHMKKYTVARLVTVDLPPIYGAVRAAAGALGEIDENFYENFKKSYGDIMK